MTSRAVAFRRHDASGTGSRIARALVVEMPISIEIDGIGYAVMMATPADLADFATGFCLSERLVDRADQVAGSECVAVGDGILLRVSLAGEARGKIHDRVRHRASDSSCGLCGIESLEQAFRPLPRVEQNSSITAPAVFGALSALRAHQRLGSETGAAHAAAAIDPDGAIRLVREDVGRHNAFDKLIGAMARRGLRWDGGFALLTSRLSYELVEKAALSGCGAIAAISAPTTLAVERAAQAGIRVFPLARADALLEAV
jgi:FdhD protein